MVPFLSRAMVPSLIIMFSIEENPITVQESNGDTDQTDCVDMAL